MHAFSRLSFNGTIFHTFSTQFWSFWTHLDALLCAFWKLFRGQCAVHYSEQISTPFPSNFGLFGRNWTHFFAYSWMFFGVQFVAQLMAPFFTHFPCNFGLFGRIWTHFSAHFTTLFWAQFTDNNWHYFHRISYVISVFWGAFGSTLRRFLDAFLGPVCGRNNSTIFRAC